MKYPHLLITLFHETLFLSGISLLVSLVPLASFAQDAKQTVFWGQADAYLDKQATYVLNAIDKTLTENPPATKGTSVAARKMALLNLDQILHETRYDSTEALHHFMEMRMEKVLNALKRPVSDGMEIYKLYNDGFIVRTKSVTLAFDLYRGPSLITDSAMLKLSAFCDILFISHAHSDHADPLVADAFLKAGKQVVCPTDLWKENREVTHLCSEKIFSQQFVLAKGRTIDVTIFPGHQDELLNNIYVVTTPEKLTVAQTGDQYLEEDMPWIRNASEHIPALDVMIVNCWAMHLPELVAGFNPRVLLTGHENELGHTIDHRESYWLTYSKLEQIDKPSSVMTWGECYHFHR
jgi:L-ascorbate metabolism protein UlaG (beta-lactamase superfamily)